MANITVITKDNNESYATNLESKLFEERILFINTQIDNSLMNSIVGQLLYLDSVSSEPIHIYISSPGGDISSGMGIVDVMNMINSPIYTYSLGLVASMAAIIFIYGKKRFMLPNSELMLHQPLAGIQGQASDIDIAAKRIIKTKQNINKIIAEKSRLTVSEVEKITDRDTFFGADEAIKAGLADMKLEKIISAKDIEII